MREKLIDILTSFYGVDPMYFGVEAQQLADHLIANGVEIPVHCCDCQNCTTFQQAADSEVLLFCEKWKGHQMVDPTDFCSYGERKEPIEKVFCKDCKHLEISGSSYMTEDERFAEWRGVQEGKDGCN